MARVLPGDPFWDLLVRDAREWGMNARDVAAVMMPESRIDPAAKNGKASGLNQITNPKNYAPLSQDAYLKLSASDQWELAVRKYFDGQIKAHPGVAQGGVRDLYWVNFLPATYKRNAPDDYVIVEAGKNYGTADDPLLGEWILRDNQSLILPGENVIRPRGLTAAIAKQLGGARWKEVLGAITAAEGGPGIAWNPPTTRPSSQAPAPKLPRVAEASMAGPALLIGGVLAFAMWKSRKARRI